jgi:hypothetical protein
MSLPPPLGADTGCDCPRTKADPPPSPTTSSRWPGSGSTCVQWKHTSDKASMAATKGYFMGHSYHATLFP